MSQEKQTEWRIVLHDGVVNGEPGPKDKVFPEFDKIIEGLKQLGIPKSHFPHLEGRINWVETIVHEGDWRNFDEVRARIEQPEMPTVQDYPAQHSSGKHREPVHEWAPTDAQIQRVRRRRFGWGDPCVICGVVFQQCKHTPEDTERYVNSVKEWLKGQL